MDRVDADPKVIEELRQQFDRFYYDQKAVIERTEWLIGMAIEDLEGTEYRWQKEAEHCERQLAECEEEAWHAAQLGAYVDCSSWERGLEECQHNLDVVRYWRGRVDAAVEQYRQSEQALKTWFDWELPRVRRYLDDRAKALRAFLAAHLPPNG